MASKAGGRQAVFLVTPPDDWKPERPWSFPPFFANGQLVATRQTAAEAAGFARLYNKRALEQFQRDKEPVTSWAVVFRHLKPNWKGGAA